MEVISQNPYIYIYIGDSYKLIKEIPDKSIDLVYIDIPYDLTSNANGYYSGGGAFGIDKRRYQTQIKEQNIISGIDYSILDELCRVLKSIYVYIWCSKQQIQYLLNYFLDKGCYYELLVWCKTNPTPTCNGKYLSDLEYCLMFREKGTKIYGTYETKHKYYISKNNAKDKKMFEHPTIKPLDIVKNHIINSSNPGDTVLDCFMGSGTTGVACKELDRNFIGMEISKEYYQIAKDRIMENNEQLRIGD